MARRGHLVADPRIGIGLSLACLAGFWVLLKDATDDRGREQPKWIRWATWW